MLKDLNMHVTIPASDLDRAKKFYQEKLGFDPPEESPGGLRFKSGDYWLVVYPTPNAGKSPATVGGWKTDNIEELVGDLKQRGVQFEEYDFPQLKTVDGIATRDDVKSAWFKDSEGNILGIVQFLD